MARFHFVCTFVLFLAPAAAARAGESISEGWFLARMDSTHAAFVVLDEQPARAHADLSRAGALHNPVLDFEHESPIDDFRQMTWALSWQPPLDGRRRAAKASATAALDAARSERRWSGIERRVELRADFASWAIAAERESRLQRCAGQLRELATHSGERARSGEESALNARRMDLAAVEVEALAARTATERIRTKSVIDAWLGGGARAVTPLLPTLPAPTDSVAAASHPLVLARRGEVRAAEARLRLGRRFVTFPELFAGWQTVEEPGFESGGWVFGLSWPIPVFDYGQGERQEAHAALAGARARLVLEETGLAAGRAAAEESYRVLRAAAAGAFASVSDADDVIASAMAMYRLGESSVTDLLDTIRTVVSAQEAALDLYDAALAAHRKLELAAGRPLTTVEGSRP